MAEERGSGEKGVNRNDMVFTFVKIFGVLSTNLKNLKTKCFPELLVFEFFGFSAKIKNISTTYIFVKNSNFPSNKHLNRRFFLNQL